MNLPKPAPGKSASGTLALDEQQRGLLNRFLRDWVYPRWRELLVAMVLTALLAAVTGAYPMIIKVSFDMLMKDQSGSFPTCWWPSSAPPRCAASCSMPRRSRRAASSCD